MQDSAEGTRGCRFLSCGVALRPSWDEIVSDSLPKLVTSPQIPESPPEVVTRPSTPVLRRYVLQSLRVAFQKSPITNSTEWMAAFAKLGKKITEHTILPIRDGLFSVLKASALLSPSQSSDVFLYLGYRALTVWGYSLHEADRELGPRPKIWLPPPERSNYCHRLLW
ncbi:hypothetical protein HPB47_003944 [Ixodes persulcatus]|uniref:Uncharacterized protein n=1 Tax=Ixodes persulcatus TaxID=34615 RepID=A0AC60PH33_IXOPE|nr:hypothetical protein HPB47_003944 [Ixodes persulcatus]